MSIFIRRAVRIYTTLLLFCGVAMADSIHIVASSDLRVVMPALTLAFQHNTGHQITYSYGASGALTRQIVRGKQADLFLSDSPTYVSLLVTRQLAMDSGRPFASGRLSLAISRDLQIINEDGAVDLITAANERRLKQIAIPSPDISGNGQAIQSAMKAAQLWQPLQAQIRTTTDSTEALQLLLDGQAEAAILPLQITRTPQFLDYAQSLPLQDQLYPAIFYQAMLLKQASRAAIEFYNFLKTPEAINLLMQQGLMPVTVPTNTTQSETETEPTSEETPAETQKSTTLQVEG